LTSKYQCAGTASVGTAAINEVVALLWNPHASKPLWVREIWYCKTGTTADYLKICRATSTGTLPATSSVTPDIDNDRDRMLAPGTGAMLYLGHFVNGEPALNASVLSRHALPSATGSGFICIFDYPIRVGPGEGLAVASSTTTAPQPADVTFVWEE